MIKSPKKAPLTQQFCKDLVDRGKASAMWIFHESEWKKNHSSFGFVSKETKF